MNSMNSMNRLRRHQRRRAGLGVSFVEVVVAAGIVGMVFVAATWAMTEVTITKTVKSTDPPIAAALAREIHQLARTLPTAISGAPAATQAGNVGNLDTLDGARFAPPIDALLGTHSELAGWSQDVDLEVFDILDLSAPISGALNDVPAHDGTLIKLTVDISQRGVAAGSYIWWLTR